MSRKKISGCYVTIRDRQGKRISRGLSIDNVSPRTAKKMIDMVFRLVNSNKGRPIRITPMGEEEVKRWEKKES